MSAASPLPVPAVTQPLVAGDDPRAIVAHRHGRPITAREFLDDVARIAARLPAGRHVLNTCADRYRFAVGFAAIAASGRISLLPSTLTSGTIAQLLAFAPDAIELTDGETCRFDLPSIGWPDDDVRLQGRRNMPAIAGNAVVAYVFTSGSTGTPIPHPKTWGALVDCVRAEAAILGLDAAGGGPRHALLGTVPPQHMYGFETTVLQPLVNGFALAAARPLYPADIAAELSVLPRPRILVTTPFHLRTLLDAGIDLPPVDLIVSATAPLSTALARQAEARLRAPLREIYGSTETGQIASRRTIDGAAWTLFPGVRLAHDHGRAIASGGHVSGRVPIDDVLELLDERRFVLHGRSADMVNIAGKRSSLAYLDRQLRAIAGVADGAFWMPENDVGDGVTRLLAAVVAPALDGAALRRALRERIDPAFLPRRIVFVDRLPRNATGKLPAAALRALFGEPAPPPRGTRAKDGA